MPTGVVADAPGGADRVVVLGVDVVAEADHEVEVLLRQQRVGVEIAEREVLAGEEGEANRLVRVGRERGPEAPDRALLVARREAVVVLLVRLRPVTRAFA